MRVLLIIGITWALISVPAGIAAAVPPRPASPGTGPEPPGEHLRHGKRLWTIRKYEDGAVFIWDQYGKWSRHDGDWDLALLQELL